MQWPHEALIKTKIDFWRKALQYNLYLHQRVCYAIIILLEMVNHSANIT